MHAAVDQRVGNFVPLFRRLHRLLAAEQMLEGGAQPRDEQGQIGFAGKPQLRFLNPANVCVVQFHGWMCLLLWKDSLPPASAAGDSISAGPRRPVIGPRWIDPTGQKPHQQQQPATEARRQSPFRQPQGIAAERTRKGHKDHVHHPQGNITFQATPIDWSKRKRGQLQREIMKNRITSIPSPPRPRSAESPSARPPGRR